MWKAKPITIQTDKGMVKKKMTKKVKNDKTMDYCDVIRH